MSTDLPAVSTVGACRRRTAAATLIAGLVSAMALTAPAMAVVPSTPDSTDVVNGYATSIARAGNTVYVGGSFTQIGPRTGPFVGLDPSSGAYDTRIAQVTSGSVFAVASDGAGGEYIGGDFATVGGVSLTNAAHILADGQVDPNWAPNPDSVVRAIAVSGNTVYLGGNFSHIENASGTGTVARADAAAVDTVHGYDTGWNPSPNSTVLALGVSGPVVYLGGAFTTVENASGTGTDTRDYAAAVDATTGDDTSWNSNLDGDVDALALGGGIVYLGGSFSNVENSTGTGTVARPNAAAVDGVHGYDTGWNPSPDGTVDAVAVSGSAVYIGGSFAHVENSTGTGPDLRLDLAAVDATTGDEISTWRPAMNGTVLSIVVGSGAIYVGGTFTNVESQNGAGGVTRPYLAALDLTRGWDTGWNPSPGSTVFAVSLGGSKVFAGGTFDLVNGQPRSNAAAVDASSGQPTGWNPSPDGIVEALGISGNAVYLGGSFTHVENSTGTGTVARAYAAAVDATNGYDTGWNPSPSGTVFTLAVSGNTVYFGGNFTTIENGAEARGYGAAVDASTGAAAAGWDPGANGTVLKLLLSGNTVYLGGDFTSLGATLRNYAGAVDPTTGAVNGWDPNASDAVTALALSGNTVYLGGYFTTVNGSVARHYAAAVDASSGVAAAWNPSPSSVVGALAVSAGSVYLEGAFRTIENSTGTGTVSRVNLASVDTVNGWDTGWSPPAALYLQPSVIVQPSSVGVTGQLTFAADGTLYAAGFIGGGFASFSVPPVSTSAPVIGGTAVVGQTLTCSTGGWSGTTPQSYAYQWLRSGVLLSGGATPTHVVAASDVGSTLACQVTATNVRASVSALSAGVAVAVSQAATPIVAALVPSPANVPNSNFEARHAPFVNTTTAAVSFYDLFYNPGRLTWHVYFHNGDAGLVTATIAARRCPAYSVRLHGRCRPEWILFGQGSKTVTGPGPVHWSVSPSAAARPALRMARRRHLSGLPVVAVATFQSAYGGSPVTHIVRVVVSLHWH